MNNYVFMVRTVRVLFGSQIVKKAFARDAELVRIAVRAVLMTGIYAMIRNIVTGQSYQR